MSGVDTSLGANKRVRVTAGPASMSVGSFADGRLVNPFGVNAPKEVQVGYEGGFGGGVAGGGAVWRQDGGFGAAAGVATGGIAVAAGAAVGGVAAAYNSYGTLCAIVVMDIEAIRYLIQSDFRGRDGPSICTTSLKRRVSSRSAI
jgi:hypothetical protein